jgi:hypothetical protein
MVDRYTKVMLTIIAAALCLLAWQGVQVSPQAQAQMAVCTMPAPCPVTLVGLGAAALPVFVTNK